MEEHRYTDEETRNILRLAADQDVPRAQLTRGGFTLSELVSIGEEAGLDPLAVRRAATVSPVAPAGTARLVLGGPVRPAAHAHARGRLDAPRASELAVVCDRVFGRRGETRSDEGSWTWREEHGPGRTTVQVRHRDGASDVTVEADRQGWALLTVLGSLGAAVVGLEAVGGVGGIAAALGVWVAVLAPVLVAGALARLVFPRLTRGLAQDVERAALAAVAAIDASEVSPPGGTLSRPLPPAEEDEPGRR